MNDVKFYLDAAEKKMKEAVAFLDDSLAHIRAGKANVKILDSIRVEYYGSKVPIGNVANVSTPDQRTIAIMPWEKTMLPIWNRFLSGLPLSNERRMVALRRANNSSMLKGLVT